ncbi:MAG: hypothetical protein M5R40_18905 [Anaerolineae bacterium]|nr:hypothetical protein [Anaerolineae bacterium]
MRVGELNPRERVLLALDHQPTDRVPVDFLGTDETWANLKQHLGLADTEAVYRRLGVDLRHPRMEYVGPPYKRLPDGSYIDAWGIQWTPQAYPFGVYYEIGNHALAHITDASQLDDYPWPDPAWWRADAIADYVRQLDAETPYALALEEFGDPGGFFEISWYLRGMEQFMIDMLVNPDIAHEILRRVTDVYLGRLRSRDGRARRPHRPDLDQRRHCAPERPDALPRHLAGADLPQHERFNRRVHELGARVMYHSCGSVIKAIPGLIEMGIDVLDVIQVSAADMDPAVIKARFGDRLAFHGGVDVQGLLPVVDTPEAVADAVRRLIDILGEGGGYILSPSHNIQADVTPQKILAIYNAAGSLTP